MVKITKRILTIAVTAAFVLSAVLLCSCQKRRRVFANEPITLPLEETYTLSYWANFDNTFMQSFTSFADHPYYKWLEEKTNIHIDFQSPTIMATSDNDAGRIRGEWFTLLASGDMTDMVEHYYFTVDTSGSTIDSANDDEMYYMLNDYVEMQMNNFNALREQYATIDKLMVTPLGNIMYIPKITGIEDDNKGEPVTKGLAIRKDFLDVIQEDVPVTIEDWHRVLSKFQVSLGVQNPLMLGDMALDCVLEGDPFLSAYGVSYKYYIDEDTGKLAYGCVSEGMKSYVTLLNGWYAEGLLNCTTAMTDAIRISDNAGAFYVTLDQLINCNALATNPDYELVACPYPVENEGDSITVCHTYMPIGNREVNCVYVTYNCESPALAVKWLDQNFSEEAFTRASYGEEGADHTIDGDGKIVFTDKILNDPDGRVCGVYKNSLMTAMYRDRELMLNYVYTDEQRTAVTTWSNATRERSVLRTTSMNMTEEDIAAMSNFGNFFMLQFGLRNMIRGGDLTNWDSFVEDMNNAGIQEEIAIYQNAWDRYLAS